MALDVKQPRGYRKAWNGSPKKPTRVEVIDRLRGYLLESAMSHTERFELHAERFYVETGFMAPGKSVALAMAGSFTDEERNEAWDEWNRLNKQQWQQDMREVLVMLESATPVAAVDPHV